MHSKARRMEVKKREEHPMKTNIPSLVGPSAPAATDWWVYYGMCPIWKFSSSRLTIISKLHRWIHDCGKRREFIA
jgi:hypothetical protein